jgi:hypothetical protein
MITRATSFKTDDGECFHSLDDAQAHELATIIGSAMGVCNENGDYCVTDGGLVIAKALVEDRKRVIDILTTTETSLVKARAINGGRKPRRDPRSSNGESGFLKPRLVTREEGVNEETSNVPSQEVQ